MSTRKLKAVRLKFIVKDAKISYIAVGSRQAPSHMVELMWRLAKRFAELDFTLRTLNNSDIDTAVVEGALASNGAVQIYVPWRDASESFLEFQIEPTREGIEHCYRKSITFQSLRSDAKALKARVANLLLGPDSENRARFVVCWSGDGAEGFREITRHTGEITDVLDMNPSDPIPVFNFSRKDAMSRLTALIEQIKLEPRPTPCSLMDENQLLELIGPYQDFGVEQVILHPQC